MIQAMKDKALSTGAKIAMNQYAKSYGEITHLTLNSKFKSMMITILLYGEKESLDVNIEHYEITEDNHLKISGVTTSRIWLNTLANTHFEGKEFKIPSEYAQMLRSIV